MFHLFCKNIKLHTHYYKGLGSWKKNELKTLIDRTQFSASVEEARYYLNGLYVHAKNEGDTKVLRVVATDGHGMPTVVIRKDKN